MSIVCGFILFFSNCFFFQSLFAISVTNFTFVISDFIYTERKINEGISRKSQPTSKSTKSGRREGNYSNSTGI